MKKTDIKKDRKCKYCNNIFKNFKISDIANHCKHCDSNPNKGISDETREKLSEGNRKRNILKYGEFKFFSVICDTCNSEFKVKEREKVFPKKEKYYCNRKCANSVGANARIKKYNYNQDTHRDIVLKYYGEIKCIICGEKNVVDVHHNDGNKDNNLISNLVPLCPTHHMYIHRGFKDLILEKINKHLTEL